MNSIDTYAQDVATRRFIDSKEIKSMKTMSVKTANAISKAISDSSIDHLYDAKEIEILRKAGQLIDRRARALTKAAKMKVSAEKEWRAKLEAEMKEKKAEIHERIFGERNDNETTIVIKSLADFIRVYPMRYFEFQPRNIDAMIDNSNVGIDELKNRIVNALFTLQEQFDYTERFKFDRFDAYCDQKLAEARFSPKTLNRSDDAALSL
ncbi:MAG: hypothetical protein G8D91_00355 [gamma proteobacterium symbiont of Clathrolucina costata]